MRPHEIVAQRTMFDALAAADQAKQDSRQRAEGIVSAFWDHELPEIGVAVSQELNERMIRLNALSPDQDSAVVGKTSKAMLIPNDGSPKLDVNILLNAQSPAIARGLEGNYRLDVNTVFDLNGVRVKVERSTTTDRDGKMVEDEFDIMLVEDVIDYYETGNHGTNYLGGINMMDAEERYDPEVNNADSMRWSLAMAIEALEVVDALEQLCGLDPIAPAPVPAV